MYCRRKKFLPACWHLSSVLLESEVWVRPAKVGALFLHNLRVCLTFWNVMYRQNNVALFLHNLRVCLTFWHVTYPQNNVALFWHSLRVCWLFWHAMYLQNDVALFWHNLRLCWLFCVFQAVCRKGLVEGWWPFIDIDPFWVPGTQKRIMCSNRDVLCRWDFGNELGLGVPITWWSSTIIYLII